MKTVAVMPVKGREPLLFHTVSRLSRNGITVICAGHSDGERAVCENAGAIFYYCPPAWMLGNKIQYCVDKAREHNPDYLLIMGSSDFITDNWMDVMSKVSDDGYMMVGTAGCYFLDLKPGNVKKMIYWKGYVGKRAGEPGGIGRVIPRKVLDLLNWQIFDKNINSSLDGSTMRILNGLKHKWGDKVVLNYNNNVIKALSISTYRWVNMHSKWLYDIINENNDAKRKEILTAANCIEIVNHDDIILKFFPDAMNVFNE